MTVYTIWDHSTVTGPSSSTADTNAVSLGTEFSLSATGWVQALHFWRADGSESGTVVGGIFDVASATEVAGTAVTFTTNTTGWLTATLTTPVQLNASQRYVVAIYHPSRYAHTAGYWTTGGPGAGGITSGIITAPSSDAVTTAPIGQGRYDYGLSLVAPTQTFGAANYWSDVSVSDTAPNAGTGLITGTGTITGTGSSTRHGTGNLTGTGNVTATGTATRRGTGALAAAGSINGTGVATRRGTATVTAVGSVTGAGLNPGSMIAHHAIFGNPQTAWACGAAIV